MMKNMEDTVLDELDFDYEDTNEKELKNMLKDALVKIDSLDEEVQRLNKLVSKPNQVSKKAGRPRNRMFYNNIEITDADLIRLKNELTLLELLDGFTYEKRTSKGMKTITPKAGKLQERQCRDMIKNRTKGGV